MISLQDMINFYKKDKRNQGDPVTAEEKKTDDNLSVISDNSVGPETDYGLGVSTKDVVKDKKVPIRRKNIFVPPVNNKDSENSQLLEILRKNKPKTSETSKMPSKEPAITPEAISNSANAAEVVKSLETDPNVITTDPIASPLITQDNVIVSVATHVGESEAYIDDGQVLECVNCEQTYSSVNDLNNHQCGSKRPEIFECNLCNIKFKKRRYLKDHIKQKHLKLPHTCQKCSKEFPTDKTLNKHFLSVHVNHECQFCKLILKNANSLKTHKFHCKKRKEIREPSNDENIVPSSHEKTTFRCTECKKMCKTKTALEEHVSRQHTQRNCQYCGHTFKNKEVLRIHLYKCKVKRIGRDQHEGPEETVVNTDQVKLMGNNNNKKQKSKGKSANYEKTCNLCQKKFRSKGGFYKHMNNVHKENENTGVANNISEVIIIDAEAETLSEVPDNILMFEL